MTSILHLLSQRHLYSPFPKLSVKAIRTLFSLAQDFTYSTSASVSCINALIATTGSTEFLILLT